MSVAVQIGAENGSSPSLQISEAASGAALATLNCPEARK